MKKTHFKNKQINFVSVIYQKIAGSWCYACKYFGMLEHDESIISRSFVLLIGNVSF